MTSFKDELKNEWKLNINVLTVKTLREKHVIKLTDPEELAALFDDAGLQYEVVWNLVEEQARQQNIDEKRFAEIFTNFYAEASGALVGELKNFFQKCEKPQLNAVIDKTLIASKQLRENAVKALSSQRMDQYMESIVKEEQDRVEALFTKRLGETNTTSSGDLPGS